MKLDAMTKMIFWFVIVLSFLNSFEASAQQQQGQGTDDDAKCSVCVDREPLTLPNKTISIPGYEFIQTCGQLEGVITFFGLESLECQIVQSASTLCGCKIPPKACFLCGDNGTRVPEKLKNSKLDYSLEAFGGLSPTCELLESYLHSTPSDTEACNEQQLAAGDKCCKLTAANATVAIPTEQSTEEFCFLCNGDGVMQWPTKEITTFVQELGLDILFANATRITCRDVEMMLTTSLRRDSPLCHTEWSIALQGLCGCPLPDDYCYFECEGANPETGQVPWPDEELPQGLLDAKNVPINPSCDEFQSFITHYTYDSSVCLATRFFNHLCGCNNGERIYLGAKTKRQKALLAWAPRISGCISLIGSLLMILDVYNDRKKRASIYHQLAFAMASFDLFNSTAWMLSTLPMPTEYFEGVDSQTYGAKGNERTCKAQAFFVQLGYTGIFYNLALSIYYMLVVKYNIRETRMKQLRKWLHIPPLTVGIAMAFAGIPYYQSAWYLCHIAPPPTYGHDWTYIIVFSIFPISVVMMLGALNMSLVYYHVYKQDQAANRWRIGVRANEDDQTPTASLWSRLKSLVVMIWNTNDVQHQRGRRTASAGDGNNRLSKAVLYQALLYMTGFFMTWPIYFMGNFRATRDDYGFWLAMVALNPLQGFWNALVYFRTNLATSYRKLVTNVSNWKEARKDKRRVRLSSGATAQSNTHHASRRSETTSYLQSPRPQANATPKPKENVDIAKQWGLQPSGMTTTPPSSTTVQVKLMNPIPSHLPLTLPFEDGGSELLNGEDVMKRESDSWSRGG